MDLTFGVPAEPTDSPVEEADVAYYLLGDPEGEAGRRVGSGAFEGWTHCTVPEWLQGPERVPGVVLVAVEDVSATQLVEIIVSCAGDERWFVVSADPAGDGYRILSASHDYTREELSLFGDGAPGRPYPLGLRRVLKDVSAARHDLNNPLTSALAETQLALMDEPGGELGASLNTIQTQLRRLRDMLKLLSPIRVRG